MNRLADAHRLIAPFSYQSGCRRRRGWIREDLPRTAVGGEIFPVQPFEPALRRLPVPERVVVAAQVRLGEGLEGQGLGQWLDQLAGFVDPLQHLPAQVDGAVERLLPILLRQTLLETRDLLRPPVCRGVRLPGKCCEEQQSCKHPPSHGRSPGAGRVSTTTVAACQRSPWPTTGAPAAACTPTPRCERRRRSSWTPPSSARANTSSQV